MVGIIFALLAMTPLGQGVALALGVGLGLIALGRWRPWAHAVGAIAAALGTLGLAAELLAELGPLGLAAGGVVEAAVAGVLSARGRRAAVPFVVVGGAVLGAGVVWATHLLPPLGSVIAGAVVGAAVAIVLVGRGRGSRAVGRRPSSGAAWAAGIAGVMLLGLGAAGQRAGWSAAAIEARLSGQPAPPRLPGSGWIYFNEAGGPRFVTSRVVVLPGARRAAGGCANGGGIAISGTGGPGAGPSAAREIAYNPLTCQTALREGRTAR
jgi:hypothetical protein